MNTLVSFELSKLLKEKGFDKLCNNYTSKRDGDYFSNERQIISYKNYNEISDTWSRPTISDVVMWLYEKHEIWIEISLTDNSRGFYFDYTIVTSKDRDFNDEDCFDSAKRIYDKDKHDSPTEAYEAGIEYVLKTLI